MESFVELQARLGAACAANKPGSRVPHVLVVLPSFSIGESLLSHYANRIPSLEHRYLLAQLMLHRIPGCELVFLTSQAPSPVLTDYYLSLVPAGLRASVRARFRTRVAWGSGSGPVATRLLDHPEQLDSLRTSFRGRPAFIEPWNVTDAEVEVARRLGAPLNGTAPELWPLGFKSAGRRLLREAGVPVPPGCEDVRTVEDVMAAVRSLRTERPRAKGAVVKLDDSGAGDGNMVLGFPTHTDEDSLVAAVGGLPAWFLDALRLGGVVEELVDGVAFSSPSVQVDISPDGSVTVLATHEQVLGGDNRQVYTGCSFPADPVYAAELGRHGDAVGAALARRGARGRFSLDFAATSDDAGRWRVYGLEVNLRKGGTTHPYAALRNLVPGRYDVPRGQWLGEDGAPRCYRATDNLVEPDWTGLAPDRVITAVDRAGLGFDWRTGTGVVLHMLTGLGVDGRFGLTAVGRTPEHAAALYDAVPTVVAEVAASRRALT